ncbi:hypothetical protein HNQ94_001806 [Salirhabdus euzebyi]|uniref:Uncharacterized protein n=1 Tax=Salirhabdus euzebyi TaxID=394506 RepID=A0A841Q4P0_9BACI|nr:hypothetical protein [Salirhabdus euzebyi]
MWGDMFGRLPSGLIFTCTLLSFLIPYTIFKVNQFIHKHADPPWKKGED